VSVDVAGVAALGGVSLEWLLLGWLSGIRFPEPGRPAACASWALRLLVGAALVAAAQFALALVGVGFASIPLVLLVGAAAASFLRVSLRRAAATAPTHAKQVPVERRELIGWALLGIVLVAALLRSLSVPEAGWDAYSHWGLRAQAFAQAGTIVNAHSEHEYYPPLVPLLEAWLYAHRGAISIDLGKTIWAVVGGAFAVCLGWHLRLSLRDTTSTWLAPYLGLGVLLATPALEESFWTGQADLALTACLCLVTLAVYQWWHEPDPMWLAQIGVFSAAAALTKFEGPPRLGILVIVILVEAWLCRRARMWSVLLAVILPALLASGLWTLFQLTHAIPANAEHVGTFQPLAVLGVLGALVAVFGGVRTGGGLVVAALAWVASARWLLIAPLRLLVLVVVGQALATLLAFLLSATSPETEVATSATRLVEQFLPIALFVGALGLLGACAQPRPRSQATYNRRGR
jgi:hypothetical protein